MSEKNIYLKLVEIQNELNVPKNQRNDYGGYNYRNCEDIFEAVKPVCLKHGVCVLVYDEPVQIGMNHYIKATAVLTDGKETIEVAAYAREADSKKGMDLAQVTGSTSSYARKYALSGLLCLDDNKEIDAGEPDNMKKSSAAKKPKAAPKQVKSQKPSEIICPVCGKVLKGYTSQRSGNWVPPERELSLLKMCNECYMNKKSEVKQ
ncbi:MAG: ERF family protein [Ruminococcus sp.]|nr:ERF family protein [Ruminococcus sp.]